MKDFILLDDNNIIRCIASQECNLHKDKLHLKKDHIETGNLTVGDEYNPKTKVRIERPENYPPENIETKRRILIADKLKAMAIEALQSEGKWI